MIRVFAKSLCRTTLSSALFAGCVAAHAAGVSFVKLKDGGQVSNPVHLKFAVDGMKVAPAGDMTPGTGHHHLLIDGQALPSGEVVPVNNYSIHYGQGQTETDVTLPSGDHTLTMQFADGAYRSYGPEMSQTIKVYVK